MPGQVGLSYPSPTSETSRTCAATSLQDPGAGRWGCDKSRVPACSVKGMLRRAGQGTGRGPSTVPACQPVTTRGPPRSSQRRPKSDPAEAPVTGDLSGSGREAGRADALSIKAWEHSSLTRPRSLQKPQSLHTRVLLGWGVAEAGARQ